MPTCSALQKTPFSKSSDYLEIMIPVMLHLRSLSPRQIFRKGWREIYSVMKYLLHIFYQQRLLLRYSISTSKAPALKEIILLTDCLESVTDQSILTGSDCNLFQLPINLKFSRNNSWGIEFLIFYCIIQEHSWRHVFLVKEALSACKLGFLFSRNAKYSCNEIA